MEYWDLFKWCNTNLQIMMHEISPKHIELNYLNLKIQIYHTQSRKNNDYNFNVLRFMWWEWLLKLLEKSSKRSNKIRGNLGLGTPHRKNQERVPPTHRRKDRVNTDHLRTTSLGRKQRNTLERQRNIPGSGTTSIRAHGITLLISTQSSHWWLRWKPLN
jgi:hypothetical protein